MTLDPRLHRRLAEDTPARSWVIDTLTAASERPEHAGHALRQASREARKLRSRERRALWDVVYALIRHRAALLEARPPVPETPWASALDRWLDRPEPDVTLPDPLRLDAPPEVAADLRATFGDAFEAWLTATNTAAPTTLRVNVARTSRDALRARLARDGVETRPVGVHGLQLEGRANVLGHASHREGLFEVQDLASQQIAERVEAAGHTVLDLCAGAGGKTLALAAAGGRVTATDVRDRALDELRRRAARARVRVEVIPLETGADGLAGRTFDRVLVDAPCSGTGVWRRHPEYRWRLGSGELDRLGALQRELIARGAAHVRPGGRLVYATCSVLRREDEDVVEAFLADHSGFARLGPDLRTSPHTGDTDGMFAAVLERTAV